MLQWRQPRFPDIRPGPQHPFRLLTQHSLKGYLYRDSCVLDRVLRFLADEEGLVTLEWVALAAAVIILAVGVISVIQGRVNTAASTIGSKIVSTVQSNS